MKTAWSNLPNAKYIDQILLSLKTDPEMWYAERKQSTSKWAWYAAWDAAWDARKRVRRPWDAVREMTKKIAREAGPAFAWYAIRDVGKESMWETAGGAILSLIAYDRAGSLFNLSLDQVRVLSALGDSAAILIEPAVRILKKESECRNS
jgi:hypothetical protein